MKFEIDLAMQMAPQSASTTLRALWKPISSNQLAALRRVLDSNPRLAHLLKSSRRFTARSYSPLTHAVARNRTELIRVLVQEYGACVNAVHTFHAEKVVGLIID